MAATRNLPLLSGVFCNYSRLCACTTHPPAGEVLVLRHLNNLEPGQAHSTSSP